MIVRRFRMACAEKLTAGSLIASDESVTSWSHSGVTGRVLDGGRVPPLDGSTEFGRTTVLPGHVVRPLSCWCRSPEAESLPQSW